MMMIHRIIRRLATQVAREIKMDLQTIMTNINETQIMTDHTQDHFPIIKI